MIDKEHLQSYIEKNIPMAAQMRFRLDQLDDTGVRITAPLDIHVNHQGSAFGGSISSLLIINGWAQVRFIMEKIDPEANVVATENTVRYLKPVRSDFTAVSKPISSQDLEHFILTYRHSGKARILTRAAITLRNGPEELALFEGSYAAFRKSF